MSNCNICHRPVMIGVVHHAACWETAVEKIAEKICDERCKWREKCGEDQDALDDYCASCPMVKMANLGL